MLVLLAALLLIQARRLVAFLDNLGTQWLIFSHC